MDLGYPYSEEEIRDRAIRCKKYKRHLLEMKEVPDMNLRDYRRRQEEPKRVLIVRVPEQPTPVVVKEPIAAPASAKVYKVERIFKDHCKVVYRKQRPYKKYFVKWTGYSSCTWQYKSVLINDLGYSVFNKLLF